MLLFSTLLSFCLHLKSEIFKFQIAVPNFLCSKKSPFHRGYKIYKKKACHPERRVGRFCLRPALTGRPTRSRRISALPHALRSAHRLRLKNSPHSHPLPPPHPQSPARSTSPLPPAPQLPPSKRADEFAAQKSPTRFSLAASTHRPRSNPTRNTSDAHVFAFASCSISIRIVGVSSTTRRNRNHAFNGTCRTVAAGISLRSTAIIPNPPPCNSKSVDRSACSIFRQRTHSSCFNSTPAAAAPCGSKASRPSTSAHTSACAVRDASAETSRLVRPEQGGPQISVNPPRGNPPVSASISGTPADTISTSFRSRYEKGAATRPASAVSTCNRKAARFPGMVRNRDGSKTAPRSCNAMPSGPASSKCHLSGESAALAFVPLLRDGRLAVEGSQRCKL